MTHPQSKNQQPGGHSQALNRRGALQSFLGCAMAALIPLRFDQIDNKPSVARHFQSPLSGRVLVALGHLEPTSDRKGQPTGNLHLGLDMNIGQGDEDYGQLVRLISNGLCLYASSSSACGLGNTAIFEHRLADGTRLFSRYAHLDSLAVHPGLVLAGGDVIGGLGQSGCQASSHLHFDIANELAWGESLSRDPRWYPDGAPRWWLKQRFVDPYRLISTGTVLDSNEISEVHTDG